MEIIKLKAEKSQKLSKFILDIHYNINFNTFQKLLRQKDIKINGKRTNKDSLLVAGDEVEIYLSSEIKNAKIDIFYEDNNIIVVFKPRKIETVCENGTDLLSLTKEQIVQNLYAVHRLDRNTEGLVVFAKNEQAKQSLDVAFKNRTIHKFYLALVAGEPDKASCKMTAYLKKDDKNSIVYISDKKQEGYEQIKTNYKVISKTEGSALLEVELLTGKTHQIRAHLAHVNLPIIGDEKYGNIEANKFYRKKYQCLCAYKIIFEFSENDYLSYLSGKTIEVNKNKIDFCSNL